MTVPFGNGLHREQRRRLAELERVKAEVRELPERIYREERSRRQYPYTQGGRGR